MVALTLGKQQSNPPPAEPVNHFNIGQSELAENTVMARYFYDAFGVAYPLTSKQTTGNIEIRPLKGKWEDVIYDETLGITIFALDGDPGSGYDITQFEAQPAMLIEVNSTNDGSHKGRKALCYRIRPVGWEGEWTPGTTLAWAVGNYSGVEGKDFKVWSNLNETTYFEGNYFSFVYNEHYFQSRPRYDTGGSFDFADLYSFRARWYDPLTGRFLSRDPAGYSDSMCLYNFVNNNPVCLRDPSGELAWFIIPIIIIAVTAVGTEATTQIGGTEAGEFVGNFSPLHSGAELFAGHQISSFAGTWDADYRGAELTTGDYIWNSIDVATAFLPGAAKGLKLLRGGGRVIGKVDDIARIVNKGDELVELAGKADDIGRIASKGDDAADAIMAAKRATGGMKAVGDAGEEAMIKIVGGGGQRQARMVSTSGKRVVDYLYKKVAHESKNVFLRYSYKLEEQMAKDAALMAAKSIRGSHWHLFRGAADDVLDLLQKYGIRYTRY